MAALTIPHLPFPDPPPGGGPAAASLFVPGETCWRVERAERVGVIIDAEDYFTVAKTAMQRARRSILLTAWDYDSRVRLTPQRRNPSRPDRLGLFLNWLAARRPGLHIHVLKWDYAELFDIKRYQQPLFIRRLFSHPHLHYRLDDDHPTGACHHQKMLIIDDALAFCGGLDLTANRWDTRAHRAEEPARRQPDGTCYEPFHDLMMAVDGDAARALGDLFRERWRRATGEVLAPTPSGPGIDPWPANLKPLLTRQRIAIARTEPACNGREEVREVEALYRAAIASARRTIYLESQYFACDAVAQALKARLEEPDGPEVVVINPIRTSSWLENQVMIGARNRLTTLLNGADRHGRFRIFAAVTDGGRCITVHAKVMVIDDRVLRIGSANLNNRSMGLDSECDLALEAAPDDGDTAAIIGAVRDDLVAEHLGVPPEAVTTAMAENGGSLIRAIDALRPAGTEGRTLVDLESPEPTPFAAALLDARFLDPERPVTAAEMVDRVLPSLIPGRLRHWLGGLALAVLAVGLYLLWNNTALKDWATLDNALALIEQVRAMPLGPLVLVGVYVAAGFVAFPLLLLVAATAMALGPAEGFAVAMAGAVASAAALFLTGRLAGRRLLERLAGPGLHKLSRRLADSGIVAVATIRVVPVAPFTVVNLVAGASPIRFWDYVIGTVLGLAPGTLAFSLLGHQLESTLSDPTPSGIALSAGLAVVAVGLGWGAGRLVNRLRNRRSKGRDTIEP